MAYSTFRRSRIQNHSAVQCTQYMAYSTVRRSRIQNHSALQCTVPNLPTGVAGYRTIVLCSVQYRTYLQE